MTPTGEIMINKIICIAALTTMSISGIETAFAQDSNTAEPVVKLSKKERKALEKKEYKLAKIGSMCRGAAMFSLDDPFSAKDSPEYQEVDAFWGPHVDKYLDRYDKKKKRNKARTALVTTGSNALKSMGNGNLFLGAKKASAVCALIRAENLQGPTTEMLLNK